MPYLFCFLPERGACAATASTADGSAPPTPSLVNILSPRCLCPTLTQVRIAGSLSTMIVSPEDSSDSRRIADEAAVAGGTIPGGGGSAFTLTSREPSAVPVLVAVPHAGRAYPDSLVARMRHPAAAGLRLEDRYADLIGRGVADETGAPLLVAQAPRAMIDLNRAVDDMDWDMLALPPHGRAAKLGGRARGGLGLVPRRLPGMGELWRGKLAPGEYEARVAGVHAPYHRVLGETLSALRDRWGAALLVDLHSMPPLQARAGEPTAALVIGDRFGAACAGELVGAAFGYLARARVPAAHNRPYAGGYVLERHAARDRGIHCLQIEIDRRCYLDGALAEPGEGLEETVDLVAGLVRHLAAEVAELGRERDSDRWRMAAE